MSLPSQIELQSDVSHSSEQVVPLSIRESSLMMDVEEDLPNEKGAAEVKTNNLQDAKENNHCSEVYMSQNVGDSLSQTPYSFNRHRDDLWCSQYQQLETDMTFSNHSACSSCQPGSETDMGYSSLSVCSSCQPESQSDSTQTMNFPDTEEQFEEDDEMEDLLFHFDRFFKNRYEELLTEQGMHVRQIVTRALKTCTDKCCCNTNMVEMTDKSTQTEKFAAPSVVHHACEKLKQTPVQMKFKPQQKGSSLPRDKILLKLLAQTCDVTNLLQRKEYKT